MKQILFFALMISLIQSGCKKTDTLEPTPSALEGKWRMIAIKDNASGLSTTKPASIQKDVDITFISTNSTSGTIIGNTPTNDIGIKRYSNGVKQTITIPNMSTVTYVMETSWGLLFLDNISSSKEYTFESGGILNIITTNKILTFRKQ